MKIRNKITLGYVAVALLVGIVGVVASVLMEAIEEKFDEVSYEMLPVIEALEQLQVRGLQVTNAAMNYGLIATEIRNLPPGLVDAERQQEVLEEELEELGIEPYEKALQRFEELAAEHAPEYDDFLVEIRRLGNELLQQRDQFIKMKQQGVTGEAMFEAEEVMEQRVTAFLESLDHTLEHEKEEADELHEELEETIEDAIKAFLTTAAATFVGSIFLGLLIARTLSSPIMRLTKATAEIAKTKFDTRVDVQSSDEVGELAASFNQMVEDLSKTTVSKNYFESIVNSMNNSLVVLTADGIIREVNQTTCYQLGYHADELLGQPFDLIIEKEVLFQEANSDDAVDSLSFIGFINNLEIAYRTKDGQPIPVLFSGATMTDDEGKIGGYVCVAQNITELKQLGAQLHGKGNKEQ